MARMQSPSSINTFKQCPRKYYYRYIARLPSKPSIHLVRGTIAHSVLEDFFDYSDRQSDFRTGLLRHALQLLEKHWAENEKELLALDETPQEIAAYKEETQLMIIRWTQHFLERLELRMRAGLSFQEAFKTLTPKREEEYRDEELNVRGYIDAIQEHDGVVLLDYKTSKKPEITAEYRLQLGIYALLYLRRHNKVPDRVGIHFLRHDELLMEVNDELLLDAQFEIEQVHMMTRSVDISDYPKQESPLCNWCDYYEECFGKRP
jgi:putative RecB family exonuclease